MKLLCHSLSLLGLLVALPQSVAGREKFPGRIGGEDRIGHAAPPFKLKAWLNADPLEPADLKGNVLLVRWWTDTCPFCATTAPVLRELDRKYRGQGLRVIGIFHPKPPGDRSVERLRRATEHFGFTFPVAFDVDWMALHRWWLDHEVQAWTSVSFLVDKDGVIRYVHPGGEVSSGRSWTPLAEPRKLPSGIPRDRRHHPQAPRQLIPTRSNVGTRRARRVQKHERTQDLHQPERFVYGDVPPDVEFWVAAAPWPA